MSALSIVSLVVAYLVGIVPAGALFEWVDEYNDTTPIVAILWPATVPLIVASVTLQRLARVGSEWVRARRRRGTP